MRIADLQDKNIVIWGLGHEGKAVASLIRKQLPQQKLTFVDEATDPAKTDGDIPTDCEIKRGGEIEAALEKADVLIKSPGVPLYHPLIIKAKARGVQVTSLFNLWLAEPHRAKTICVTGTKGKSTTASLLGHVLKKLDMKVAVGGNIGVPIADIDGNAFDIVVIEVSSYQATDLDEKCDMAILTSLQPEHLDWHKTLDRYYADKLNLFAHAGIKIINENVRTLAQQYGLPCEHIVPFNHPENFHVQDGIIFDGKIKLGAPAHRFLKRAHNLSNVCAVLTAVKLLGLDPAAALRATEDYAPLPHRQQELGEKGGVLYVNDSIATTPHAASAALDAYRNRPITLIAGGHDRGIDYDPLIEAIFTHDVRTVVCMGPSGQRIFDALKKKNKKNIFMAASMKEVIALAKKHTSTGGVVLLSPAAPSYGLFRDFVERGEVFAKESGF